jgi:hypothetical protein
MSVRTALWIEWLATAFVLIAALYFVVQTRQWRLMVDSATMHYVVYLLHHGMKAYAGITDNNMPGACLTEAVAMNVFGGSDMAWRVYDYALLALMAGAMCSIAWPYSRAAGLFAGALFALLHGSDGPWAAAEREQVVALCLVVACAALFAAVRQRRGWLLALSGAALMLATSIKPTFAPLLLALPLVLMRKLRREGVDIQPLRWFLLGVCVVLAADACFLLRYGSVHGFMFVLAHVLPAYARLSYSHTGMRELITFALPRTLWLPALAALCIALRPGGDDATSRNRKWETNMLLAMACFGLLSYFLQAKPFDHHRYPFVAFALLLIALQLFHGLRLDWRVASIACAGVLAVLAIAVPRYVQALRARPAGSELTQALERDLDGMGGRTQLQAKVQCFDLVYGCLNALYHLDLTEHTGFTGDLLLFSATDTQASAYYRQMYVDAERKDPAQVLVITNEWFGHANSFAKIETWPEFAQSLAANYTQVIAREFPDELNAQVERPMNSAEPPAYRIYVRKSLLAVRKTVQAR